MDISRKNNINEMRNINQKIAQSAWSDDIKSLSSEALNSFINNEPKVAILAVSNLYKKLKPMHSNTLEFQCLGELLCSLQC